MLTSIQDFTGTWGPFKTITNATLMHAVGPLWALSLISAVHSPRPPSGSLEQFLWSGKVWDKEF